MRSITWKLVFSFMLVISISAVVAIYVAQVSIANQFWNYLGMGHMGDTNMGMGMGRMMETYLDTSESQFLKSVFNSLYWGALVASGFGLVIGLILSRAIVGPLKKLTYIVKEISNGNYHERVQVKQRDKEIVDLAKAVNVMADNLQTNERLRRRLMADITHELRTPLSIIQGNLEGMLDDVIEPSKQHIASIYDECLRLYKLVNNLRDLALADVGQLKLDRCPVDLNELIYKVYQLLRPVAEEKNISLAIQLPKQMPVIVADPDRLNQVLYNLMTNSLRYTPEGGRAIVKGKILAKSGGKEWVQIEVIDNGVGIPAEDLPYVFNHFYRADESRTRASGGSGIGLAIVKQLVEAHGGQVWAESEPGKGSTFYFTLPLEHAENA
ncbi:MAG: sensor histidine kinase [Bacillota bacterium]